MQNMKKLIGAALAAGATLATAGVANAGEVSANVALTTDYVFRGVSLAGNDPAIQGGFDWNSSDEMFYAGVWGSSLSSGMEMDVYGGWTPSVGPVGFDLGVIGYFYPGADDDGAEFDYYELKAAGDFSVSEQLTIGGAVYFAPENYGETGKALYMEINGSFAPSEQLEFSAAFGNQSIDDPDGPNLGFTGEDDYSTWNIGGSYAMHGFGLDLRYHDTDIDAGSDIESYTYGPTSYDSAVVFTISRDL
jgi:uncharacterized protein (TIGR02001 family)